MKPFEYAAPKTLKDATTLLGDSWGHTEILAGGTDLLTCLKQGLTQPGRVVSLRQVKGLRGIDTDKSTLRIGAMTTLAELAAHKAVGKHFRSLVTAVRGIGSPQLLSVGTVGGDLCQRPRCWYFRNGFGLLGQQGQTSLVRSGDNRYHAIFANDGPALFVSASSLGPALVALGATLTAVSRTGSRTLTAAEFFRVPRAADEREIALRPGEILREIVIPIQGLHNDTYEVRHRHGLDWPYVTATVALKLEGGAMSDARVVLGHVAPVPWSAPEAGRALDGVKLDEVTLAKCGEAAVQGARPLSGNAYKIQMTKTAVKRAVMAACC